MSRLSRPGEDHDKDGTRSSYDRVADRYALEFGSELDSKPLDRAMLQALAELKSSGPVADVGCGPGHVAAHLAGRDVSVFGVDLSPGMCSAARRATGLQFAAGDMCALPLRSESVGGICCQYALIHLDDDGRDSAYREFVRVLRPGGCVLTAFHTRDAEVAPGGAVVRTEWWDQDVRLTFRFLDPSRESDAMARAGLEPVARLDRQPNRDGEHPSQRGYLLARKPTIRTILEE